jgi:hypothetical protein
MWQVHAMLAGIVIAERLREAQQAQLLKVGRGSQSGPVASEQVGRPTLRPATPRP